MEELNNEENKIINNVLKSTWVNNEFIIKSNLNKTKPCHTCGYCPYGCVVEAFPLKKKSDKVSCKVFGHDCPMFYNAEDLSEFGEKRIEVEKEEGK